MGITLTITQDGKEIARIDAEYPRGAMASIHNPDRKNEIRKALRLSYRTAEELWGDGDDA